MQENFLIDFGMRKVTEAKDTFSLISDLFHVNFKAISPDVNYSVDSGVLIQRFIVNSILCRPALNSLDLNLVSILTDWIITGINLTVQNFAKKTNGSK